jgi:copper chaperone CopZ
MDIGKFSSTNKIILLVIIVLIAVIGGVSFSYISASNQKAVSSDTKEYLSTNIEKSVSARTDSRQALPAGELEITDNISKAILRVDGMSCSGCIYTIKSSLAGFKGVRDILVNVAAGQAEVYYDKDQLKDINRIANAITASGYPAKVSVVLSADQIKKEHNLAVARSLNYIASVGEWDISRNDFDIELAHAKSRYFQVYGDGVLDGDRGKALLDNLKVQIVSRLINEAVKMQEIQKAGFTVDAAIVDSTLQEFLDKRNVDLEKFKANLEENGYAFDYFMKKFERRVLVNKYLDDEIFNGVTDQFEKERLYTSWFNNARLLAKAVYYDKNLERLIQAKAAGGGCSSGSSCSKGN